MCIVKAFLLYFVKLEGVAKQFKGDIPNELYEELISIRKFSREEEKTIKDHIFEFGGSTLSKEDKASLIDSCKTKLRIKISLGNLMLGETNTKEDLKN